MADEIIIFNNQRMPEAWSLQNLFYQWSKVTLGTQKPELAHQLNILNIYWNNFGFSWFFKRVTQAL